MNVTVVGLVTALRLTGFAGNGLGLGFAKAELAKADTEVKAQIAIAETSNNFFNV